MVQSNHIRKSFPMSGSCQLSTSQKNGRCRITSIMSAVTLFQPNISHTCKKSALLLICFTEAWTWLLPLGSVVALYKLQFGEGFEARRWQGEDVLCLQVLERKCVCEPENWHSTVLCKTPCLIPAFSTIYNTLIGGSMFFLTFDFEVIMFNV